ncbi:MAG TPA: asparagine synthase (glutamine-hydrolyzing) [Anaerolineales bacterium]|nr:asparagine synthase (glutamine-hydrolyzing) [Anaerolineales bacterium]HNS61218.1 asparagine synthase (glutamine-hydrolyzing) [Anaerolineales bacterium]
MCGINGLWNLNGEPVDPRMFDRFTDALAHRGPDGRGVYIDSQTPVALGQRRLAIIDTTDGGRQPMPYAGGRYRMVFNGELYNFLELRTELTGAGYIFTTDSDTEVVLAAYDHWGRNCFLRFNGMWALAIWDREKKELFICRDRFGVKPMHYYFDGKRFAFASEMKAFLALDWFPVEFDDEVVAAALTRYHMIEGTERCLLKHLHRLPGGYTLTLGADGTLKKERWWNTLDHLVDVPRGYDEQVSRFRELFLDACRVRMRSDVPIGTALSGGLDSSSVLCAMREIRNSNTGQDRLASDWQKAFIATYPQAVEDERAYADEVIKHTRVDPIYCEITPNMFLDHFDEIIFQFEELSDVHVGPWMVYKAQRENGVVVSIDGHGGDELLGGYYWNINAAFFEALQPFPDLSRARDLFQILCEMDMNTNGNATRRVAMGLLWDLAVRARKGKLKSSGAQWLLAQPFSLTSFVSDEEKLALRRKGLAFQRLYEDFHYVSLPTNLRDFDRLSMAHGVEVRSPFLDWRLATYAFSLPTESKTGHGYTKRILRDAMTGILPGTIRTRKPKGGFANPSGDWLAGKLETFLRDSVLSREFQESTIWNGRQIAMDVERAFRDNDFGVVDRAWKIIQAMTLIRAFKSHTIHI